MERTIWTSKTMEQTTWTPKTARSTRTPKTYEKTDLDIENCIVIEINFEKYVGLNLHGENFLGKLSIRI